jgi:hypothetical protein
MWRGTWLLCGLLPLWLGAGEEPEPLAAVTAVERAVSPPGGMPHEPAQPVSAHELAAYTALYEVRYNGLKVGELTQSMTEEINGRQSLQTIAYTTGLVAWLKSDTVTERSIWQVDAGRQTPLSYTYRYAGRSDEIFERQDFDWRKRQVSRQRDGQTTQLAVEPGTLDKHMYQVVLRHALRRGDKHIHYLVVDDGMVKRYDFEVLGEEALEMPHLGPLICLKVKKGTTLIWVAQKYDYLPVKIEKDEDGTAIGTYLVELQGG